jgi:hypothetical protein
MDRIIYVVPEEYDRLNESERSSVARTIGLITHLKEPHKAGNILLLGPGRWGTSMASLGVPVTFAEINTVAAICEIAQMRQDLITDVSLGTHFFSEFVEMDILYFAVQPNREETRINSRFFVDSKSRTAEISPQAERWAQVIRVLDPAHFTTPCRFVMSADALRQQVLCYLENEPDSATEGEASNSIGDVSEQ